MHRPVESHSGARGNILVEPFWGENSWFFFFLKWCILVYSIFVSDGGVLPNVAGPGVAYPLPHPLDGPVDAHNNWTKVDIWPTQTKIIVTGALALAFILARCPDFPLQLQIPSAAHALIHVGYTWTSSSALDSVTKSKLVQLSILDVCLML